MNITVGVNNPSVWWGIDYNVKMEVVGMPRNTGTPQAPNPKVTMRCMCTATGWNTIGKTYTIEVWANGKGVVST